MSSNGYFSVQRARPDGSFAEADCIFTPAASAMAAAEGVLREPLATHGRARQARARVWYLTDDFSPVSVVFYRQSPQTADDIRGSSFVRGLFNRPLGIVRGGNKNDDFGVLLIIAICCLPVVIVAGLLAAFGR